MDILTKLRYDLSWSNIENSKKPFDGSKLQLLLKILLRTRSETFHAVLLIRLFCYFSNIKLLQLYCSYRLKRRYSISVYGKLEIEGGLRLPHPYGIVLGEGTIIGRMVTIGQFVTLGGNMGLKRDDRSTPTIGNWCMICANSVVAGPVIIGDDVIIGACSIVTRDIVSHTIVTSNSELTIKDKDGKIKDSIVHNKYFNFPKELIANFTR